MQILNLFPIFPTAILGLWHAQLTQNHKEYRFLSKPLMLAYLTEVGSALAADAPQMTVEELGQPVLLLPEIAGPLVITKQIRLVSD